MKKEKVSEKQGSTTDDFFYLLSINEPFKKDLHAFRIKYGIKSEGYDSQEDSRESHLNVVSLFTKKDESMTAHDHDTKMLADKYKVPANLFVYFKLFLILNHSSYSYIDLTSRHPDKNYAFDFSDEKYPTEEEWKATGRPYVKLLISENWSVYGLTLFLKRHEELIKSFFDKNKQLNDFGDRKRTKLLRDESIFNLWQKPIDELNVMCKGLYPYKYKEDAISIILKNEHGYDVSPSAIKKTAQRQIKLRDN